MTRFTDRVTRDLHQIADRSTPSSTAWESIRTRIDKQSDQPTMEVIMLSPDRNAEPKRGWMLAAAAVAGLALVGGLVFATTRSADDTVPADQPTVTLPAEPAPDAEVDPEEEAVVVSAPDPTTPAEVVPETEPAPDPTTPAEVVPETEPAPEPVTVTVAGTFSTDDVIATTTPNSSGLTGPAAWQATTVYEGQLTGTAPGIWQTWDLGDGDELRAGEHTFSGTIDGVGSGTLTYADEWLTMDGITSGKAAITGGTGDFEGAYGSAVLNRAAAAAGDPTAGTYSWDITVPPKGSLVTVTAATGTATVDISLGAPTTKGISWNADGVFTGSLDGISTGLGQGFADPRGGTFGTSRWVFTGTIDGLGTGTMTFDRIGLDPPGAIWFDVVVEGTGDFEGITGTGQVALDLSYTYTLIAPVSQ
jgi:hypothetical protein